MNLVDVVAILPFYLELILADITVPGLSVFRVVRLVRVFRLFKMSRGSITVFVDTMVRSSKPLYMLVFFTSIATVIFSSLIYYVERGQWNDELEMWMRPYLHYCPVKAGADVGPAVKDPSNWTLDSGLKEPCKWVDPADVRRRERELSLGGALHVPVHVRALERLRQCTSSRRTTVSRLVSGGAW